MAGASKLLYFKGHSYQIVQTAMTWGTAAFAATDQGGYLAKIGDSAENAAVFALALSAYDAAGSVPIAPDGGGGSYVWLGGSDSAVEGQWRWQDGSLMTYANWGAGNGVSEPDDFRGAQDHLGLSLNGWPFPSSAIGGGPENGTTFPVPMHCGQWSNGTGCAELAGRIASAARRQPRHSGGWAAMM